MRSCNLHVSHDTNGLLASDARELATQIARLANDATLRARLAAAALASPASHDPNAKMLAAIVAARDATLGAAGARRRPPHTWHPFWSVWLSVGVALDRPAEAAAATTTAAACALAALALWCSRRNRKHAELLADLRLAEARLASPAASPKLLSAEELERVAQFTQH